MVCYVQHISTSLKTSDFILNAAAAPDDGEEDGLTEPGIHFSGALRSSWGRDETIPSGSEKARREQAGCTNGRMYGKRDRGGGRAGDVNCS